MRAEALRRCDHRIQRAGVFRPLGRSRLNSVKAAFCFAIFSLVFPPSLSAAESVTLAWDENSEPNIAGYRIYYRSGSSGGRVASRYNGTGIENGRSPIDMPVYEDANLDPRFVETTLHGLDGNQNYYFVVTAYNTEGLESAPSNEASLVRAAAIVDRPTPNESAASEGGGESPSSSSSAASDGGRDSPSSSSSAALDGGGDSPSSSSSTALDGGGDSPSSSSSTASGDLSGGGGGGCFISSLCAQW